MVGFRIMSCPACKKDFASKYTYKRHIQQLHPKMEYDNVSSTQESDNENVSEENESETEENDSEDELDFWTMLIRHTVEDICKNRKAQGLTECIPSLTESEQMAEGVMLSQFMKKLREVYYDIEKIHEAGSGDSVLEKIETKLGKLQQQFEDDSFEDETQEMAWEKYKPLIRKKILENLDEFEDLVCEKTVRHVKDSEMVLW